MSFLRGRNQSTKRAVFSCDEMKSSRPDGFSLDVYKESWDILKKELLEVFENFHEKGIINETYMCLIPKKENSIKIKDFRPISLTTSLYKIVEKVLALRLREVFSEVDPAQRIPLWKEGTYWIRR